MSMIVNHNLPALSTYNVVNNTSNALQKSINKLSTGLRINSAADDAAGLAISEKMRAQTRGLDQAVGNAQDGISMIQTAEGGLNETHSILQRMRELSVQAANDTLTNSDRTYIQEEVDQLREEITRIGNTTQFNTKKLLNGDSAVLWSSSDSDTKAIVNGGLRKVDQFGQKRSIEGNYKIMIQADPGKGEVQKSDIFTVKHKDVVNLKSKSDFIDDVTATDLKSKVGENQITYTVAGSTTVAGASKTLLGTSDGSTGAMEEWNTAVQTLSLTGEAFTGGTTEMVVTLRDYDATSNMASITLQGRVTYADGSSKELDAKNFTVTAGQAVSLSYAGSTASINLTADNGLTALKARGLNQSAIFKATSSNTADKNGNTANMTFTVKSSFSAANGSAAIISASVTGGNNVDHTYRLDTGAIVGKTVALKQFYFENGSLKTGSVNLSISGDADSNKLSNDALAVFDPLAIGDTATGNVHLRDLDKFWNSEGKFLLEDPQTITINQGNGKSADVTLYAYDTLDDVAKKINSAIANELGQGQYIDPTDALGATKFATFVTDPTEASSESVKGTFLIRSLIPGSNGTISFAGDEAIINAFSLNTLQDAKESQYTVSIQDAHTGETVVDATKITGNVLVGKLHENVDVEFDAMAGTTVKWDDTGKKFNYATKDYTTTLHLSDNTTVFQIGANEGEDMGINIGDMRAHALGLDAVNVSTRDRASRSITVIDNAIDKVSMQRSKLGAYQNRLEHTVSNLTTSSENLTAAESRIRDTDMAKEMLNFSKLQIMLQAGNSMLSQANQLPQNVLSIIR